MIGVFSQAVPLGRRRRSARIPCPGGFRIRYRDPTCIFRSWFTFPPADIRPLSLPEPEIGLGVDGAPRGIRPVRDLNGDPSMTGIWWTSVSIEIFLCSLTATTAHLLMSLGQTLFHRYLGHRDIGGWDDLPGSGESNSSIFFTTGMPIAILRYSTISGIGFSVPIGASMWTGRPSPSWAPSPR